MSRTATRAAAPRAAAPPPRQALFPLWRQFWRQWRRISGATRKAIMWGFPLALVALGYGGFMLSRTPGGEVVLSGIYDQCMQATAALGLVVSDIDVEGRQTTDVQTILASLAAKRGTPILAVSPSRAKAQLEALPWVRSAAIERRLPGTLYVKLVERHPLALWQHGGKQDLIDNEGDIIAVAPGDLGRFNKLPAVVGETANKKAARFLALLQREPELAQRVTDAVLVDERRWNVRIDDQIDVLLPEEKPEEAWTRLAAIERENSILKREVQSVDMRLPDRLVLRTTPPPAPQKEAAPAKPKPAGKNT